MTTAARDRRRANRVAFLARRGHRYRLRRTRVNRRRRVLPVINERVTRLCVTPPTVAHRCYATIGDRCHRFDGPSRKHIQR